MEALVLTGAAFIILLVLFAFFHWTFGLIDRARSEARYEEWLTSLTEPTTEGVGKRTRGMES